MRIVEPDVLTEIRCLDGLKSISLTDRQTHPRYSDDAVTYFVYELMESIKHDGNPLWGENGVLVRFCKPGDDPSQCKGDKVVPDGTAH